MKREEEIKKLKQQIEELTNNWKRALADYQNFEKRATSEKEEFIKFANASLILKLLSILDILEKAQEQIKDKGLELAILEFRKVLENEGVSGFEVKPGDAFNSNIMECIETVEVGSEKKEGTVVEVISNGYKLNGKLLRTAKVKVYKKEI